MTGELRLERYDAGTVAAIYPELVQLYTDTHRDLAADPFYSIKRFEAYFAKQRAHDGFELVTARTLGRLVGVIFGFSELGGEQFGLCELMVSPNYQRRGIAKRLHDELLRRNGSPPSELGHVYLPCFPEAIQIRPFAYLSAGGEAQRGGNVRSAGVSSEPTRHPSTALGRGNSQILNHGHLFLGCPRGEWSSADKLSRICPEVAHEGEWQKLGPDLI